MIIIRPWVKLTPSIQATLDAIEPHAEEEKVDIIVTSGLRDPKDQLRIIAGYASEHKIHFPEFSPSNIYEQTYIPEVGKMVYNWQRTWSALLRNVGMNAPRVIINPPIDAEVLDNYIRPDGTNIKGQVMHATLHTSGTCFDEQADGSLQDQRDEIPSKIKVLEKAKKSGAPIRSWTIERNQNCIHVNCLKKEVI